MNQIATALLMAVLLYSNLAAAQSPNNFLIKKLQVKGLPTEAFYCTLEQDDDGFIWIATISGLYRYDGSRVKRFLRDPSDTNSMTHNYVTSLVKDKKGNIWIGTLSGFMNMYDRLSGRIKRIESHIKEPSRATIMTVKLDGTQQYILAGAAQSIYKITTTGHVIDSLFFLKAPSRLNDFWEYKKDHFFVVSSGGCFDIDWTKKEVKEVHITDKTKDFRSIETGDNGVAWVGSDKGIFFLSPQNFQVVSPSAEYDAILKENLEIRSLKKDRAGRMWIGSSKGLFVYEKNIFQKVMSTDTTFDPSNITTIFIDRNDIVWIGTSDKGLFQAYRPNLLFYSLPGMGAYAKKTILQSVWEEKAGVWMIGTIQGLYRYIFSSGKYERIKLMKPDADVQIASQMKDKKGGYWVATNKHGLFYRPPGSEQFIQFKNEEGNPHTISNNNVLVAEEDNFGRVWIGTYSGGTNISDLAYYDPPYGRIYRMNVDRNDSTAFRGSSISQIAKEGHDRLWIGSWGSGLYSYQIDKGVPSQTTFKNYNENSAGSKRISHNVVSCVKLAKNGLLWFGTVSGGLNCLDIKKDSIYWYTMKDGLPSNLIYRIEEDDQGILWLSTDNGISRFDPLTSSFMNYTKSSGLPAFNFSFLSSLKGMDGTLAFGTNDGQLIYFNPNNFKNFQNKQNTIITEIRLFNKPVVPAAGSFLFRASYLTDTIELSHDQSVISFELANMDFINPESFTYAYKLEGFDKEWTYITDHSSITYTNLDPGSYILLVKNANHQGVWNESPTKIVVIVTPPYWATLWFQGLVLLAIVAVLHLVFRYRLKQQLKIFAVRQRLHRDLHDDVGATLSSVKVYSEILSRNSPDEVITGLIKENATEMMDRLEVISWATNPQYDNLKSLMEAMLKFARPVTHASNILLIFENKNVDESLPVPGDFRQHILLIFKEAINNIIKYAEASECRVNLFINHQKFILEINDNGKGLDGRVKGSGQGLKNMYKRAEEMNGKLQMETEKNQGTIIRLSLSHPFKIPTTWYKKKTTG